MSSVHPSAATALVTLPREELARFLERARTAECETCGFLLGSVSGDQVRIERIDPARNVSTERSRFIVPHADYVAARTRAHPLEIVGLIHSHEASASPSLADVTTMRLFHWVSIIAPRERDIEACRAFVWRGRLTEVPLAGG